MLAFDFCRFCVVIQFFHPRHNGQWRPIFVSQILSITLISYLNSWERASSFPFACSVLNKGTTGIIFYNVFGMMRSLTGTSRTRSQHYTTRLSRRRYPSHMFVPSACIYLTITRNSMDYRQTLLCVCYNYLF